MQLHHSYLTELPGTFLRHMPDMAPSPALIVLNETLTEALGLDLTELRDEGAAWFSGGAVPEGADPAALAYAGHQFGGFSPALGDGRAHLLGEIRGPDGRLWDLQLKGSGRTPFSRGADGKAALGPMLREYLISEAMAALGVPTTRALAVTTTGERIARDGALVPGAVLARVAASHIRVGTFQYFAARGDGERLRALADYAIRRHYPEIPDTPERYLAFFDQVCARQAALIAEWMGLGFIHGVMNTDNMAISGETIDYGPCAFMEDYAPGTVFSSIDRQGRYAWANQPLILAWNLARLAECLLPLIAEDEAAGVDLLNTRLEGIAGLYRREWLRVMRRKLALSGEDDADGALIDDLLTAMTGADWTLTFRRLAPLVEGDPVPLKALFEDFTKMEVWLPRWQARLAPDAAAKLRAANPAVIPRNHRVEEALAAATEGDLVPFRALLAAVQNPWEEVEYYMLPAPQGFGRYVTFCGT
ncbi:YdiU family protein [Pseudomonas sp. GX19020]|uniref:protein adenylyltransferase SelO n=1 Tax=Pseudomonas sp. GX19020 TaxID=2942277 RepID=UPI00201909C7|nr:YdiU family protein [Pseudomonas sp. GX19020]MCL4066889.1 YdiU family protein [Pseudomonas sp. GX19020]